MILSYIDALTAVQEHYGYLSSELHKGIDSDKLWVHTDSSVYPTQRGRHSIHLTVGELSIGGVPNGDGEVNSIEFRYTLRSPQVYALMRQNTVTATYNFSKLNAVQFKAKMRATVDLFLKRIRTETDLRVVNGRLNLRNFGYCLDEAISEMRTTIYTMNEHVGSLELQRAKALFEEFTANVRAYNLSTAHSKADLTTLGVI